MDYEKSPIEVVVDSIKVCMQKVNDDGGAGCFIGSYAYNNVFSTYSGFNQVPITNIDALCIMPKFPEKFESFEERMKWYVERSRIYAESLVTTLNKLKTVRAQKKISSHTNNVLLFPGTSIQISYKGVKGFVSIEANCKLECSEINENIVDFIPNWEFLLIIQEKAKNAEEKYKQRYEHIFNLLDQKSRDNLEIQVVDQLLQKSEQIFRNCCIQEYRFTGTNILSDMLSFFNPNMVAYQGEEKKVSGDMKSYLDFVMDKVIEYGNIEENGKTFNLRRLINFMLLLINRIPHVGENAALVKSGGEVYRYLGHLRDTKDIDTKVFFKPHVDELHKENIYVIIIEILIVVAFILEKNKFVAKYIASFGDHKIHTKIFNRDLKMTLLNTQSQNSNTISLRHIKVGGIKLLSIDIKIGYKLNGKHNMHLTSSPLDIAFDKKPFDQENILKTPHGMQILSPKYLLEDLGNLLKNPDRIEKNIKDKTRLDFINELIKTKPPDQYINNDQATMLDVGYDLYLFKEKSELDLLVNDVNNRFTKHATNLLNATLSKTGRYKTPFIETTEVVEIADFDDNIDIIDHQPPSILGVTRRASSRISDTKRRAIAGAPSKTRKKKRYPSQRGRRSRKKRRSQRKHRSRKKKRSKIIKHYAY